MRHLAIFLLSVCFLFSMPADARGRHATGKAKRRIARRAALRPVPVYTANGMPNVQAQAAVVIDLAQGTDLYQKNPDAIRPIASISKLLAMMVVLERKLDLDTATTITNEDVYLSLHGARSRLPAGASLSNRDLLHAVLMASDNRAVFALGRAVGFAPDQLAVAMNRKAQELGLSHTTFGDPSGLDDRNRSTPHEVAKMLMAALKVPLISEITRKAHYVATTIGKRSRQIEYTNTDVYVRSKRFDVLGGKTGYTDQAGYCLAIAARLPNNREVAMVFLGAHGKLTRFADFSRSAQWLAEKTPAPALTAPTTPPSGNTGKAPPASSASNVKPASPGAL